MDPSTLITMIVPILLKWSLEEYGYRGTLLLMSGVVFNNFCGVALLQPVEKHMKKVEILDSEMDVLLSSEKEVIQDPLPEKLTDIEGKSEKNDSDNDNSAGLRKIFDTLLDKSLRKSLLLSCVCLGPALCLFADAAYVYMLPQALYSMEWDQKNVALALSLMGMGDLVMRVVFIFLSGWMLKLGSEMVYIIGTIVSLVARLGTLWSKSITAMMVYITMTGVSRCAICTLIPVVIADAVPPHKFTAAMGMFLLTSGTMNLVLSPVLGAVRDLSNSYGTAFYLMASCFAMIALFWLIELCYKRNKHKRLQRLEYLRQKKLNKT